MKFINIFFFVCYQLLRCVKKFSFSPILNISFHFRPLEGKSLYRINPDLNGYNTFVQEKYRFLVKNNFSEYYDEELINMMFQEAGNSNEPILRNGKFINKNELPDAKAAQKLEKLFKKYE